MRPLWKITREMQKIADAGSGDQEGNHVMADALLVEALRAVEYRFPQDALERDSLLDSFERIPKWYA